MRKLIVFVLVVLLFVLAVPALAQDVTPAIPDLHVNDLAQSFLVFVVGALGAWIASPATVTIVGLLKKYIFTAPPEEGGLGGDTLALVVGALLAAITALLAHFGFEQEWRTIIQVAVSFVAWLTGLGLNLMQAGRTYEKAKIENVPIVGYSRVSGNDTSRIAG